MDNLGFTIAFTIFLVGWLIAIVIIDVSLIRGEFKKRKCTVRTKGKVIRYKRGSIGGDRVHFRPPVVEYMVNGIRYTTWGPRFKTYVAKTVSSLTADIVAQQQWNITEEGSLIVHKRRNSFISITRNIAEEMYPIGTAVDVYYDPNKPKRAYAIMYYERKWIIVYLSVMSVLVYVTCIVSLVVLWRV